MTALFGLDFRPWLRLKTDLNSLKTHKIRVRPPPRQQRHLEISTKEVQRKPKQTTLHRQTTYLIL